MNRGLLNADAAVELLYDSAVRDVARNVASFGGRVQFSFAQGTDEV